MKRSRISWIRFAFFLISTTVAVLVSERGDARTLPPRAMRAGQCDIKIDCPNYKVIINGRTAGQIVCGRQTAASFRRGRIARNITPASPATSRPHRARSFRAVSR